MPKIAEIEDTPNPNAMKFILKEPLTWGITRSYDNAEQAGEDPLAAALFDIEHVTNVFYVDHWITVTQDGKADWQELKRKLAEPIRDGAGGRRAIGANRRQPRPRRSENLSEADRARLDRSTICSTRDPALPAGRRRRLYVLGARRQRLDGALPGRLRQLPEFALRHAGGHRKSAAVRSSPISKSSRSESQKD